MTISTSILSYQDCLTYLQQALDNPVGLRLQMSSIDEATFMRMRLHQARALDRKKNEKIYPPGHHMHGASEFDSITVRIKGDADSHYVYLEKTAVAVLAVEPLSEVAALPAPEPQRQLEYKAEKVETAPTTRRF